MRSRVSCSTRASTSVAGQRSQRSACRLFRPARNQVGHRLCLGEIQPVIEKRPPRKFARFGEPGAERHGGIHKQPDYDRSAMTL